jgi:hypothetical protein
MSIEPSTTQQLPVITWSLSLKTPAALGVKTKYQSAIKEKQQKSERMLGTSGNFLQYIEEGSSSTNLKTNSL